MVYRPYNLTQGQDYYGPALRPSKQQSTLWTNRSLQPFYEGQNSSGLAALGLGAAFASGFIPTRGGGRMWDHYTNLFRGIEEYSPGQVLRTFQISPLTSQFTSQARRGFGYTGSELAQNKPLREYLTRLIGERTAGGALTFEKLGREGAFLRNGRFYFGKGDVALKYASSLFSAEGASQTFGKGYAWSATNRGVGFSDLHIAQQGVAGFNRQIIGANTFFGHVGRQLAGGGTYLVTRFNRLLEAPFEMEPFKTVFGKAQNLLKNVTGRQIQFAVKEGPGLKMLGRLSAKYGLGLGAITLGYQTLDYLTRQSSFFDDTAFDEGLTHGLATVGVKANLAASRVAQYTGLHAYREAQESIAPGSTSLQSLVAFPMIGFLTGSTSVYLARIAKQMKYQRSGLTSAQAGIKAAADLKQFGKWSGSIEQLIAKKSGLYSRQDWIGKAIRKIATEDGEDIAYKFVGKIGPAKLAGLIGAGLGAAAVLPFLPGALIPGTRPDELEKIYSGQQEVAIRKGRWWEFGRSPFEGSRIMYFRPHWYARMSQRSREKSLYSEDTSPVERWWKTEFTYDFEKEHYYDRPYPITALPFEDVPLIGPLLANTIGRLIKPPKLMHTEEWMGDQGLAAMPPRFGGRIATEIGEQSAPAPISPYDVRGTIGEQAYRFTEMVGLPGFAATSIKEAITGTPDLYDQFSQLESARRAFGMERAYWDLEIGGGLGTTEALRRLYPHRRRQIPLYNPIRNLMPEWLPGAGEKSPDFLHGDPYTKVQEGELRLPGEGYAARFSELKGVRPEDYPLIHQYKILADVAPYSDKFKQTLQAVRAARKADSWGEYEENIYQTTQEQLKQRKVRKEFEEYQYLSPMGRIMDQQRYYGGEESSSLIAQINKMKASEEPEVPGIFNRLFGGYWELLAHNAETAIDQLTPISPGAKLVHTRTALEDYERTQVYGSENAFWQHPWRDFLRPFMQLSGKAFGFTDIPSHIKERRELEEYFDILEYAKNARLSNLARMSGDAEAVKEFEKKKDETLFGVNPYTFNYSSVFRALPRRERDYFNSFAEAETTEERAKILEMVPENEKALYIARWQMQLMDDVKKAKKSGILSDDQLEEANQIIEDTYSQAKSEGFPTSKELFAEYVETRLEGETYPDWYRRTKLLPQIPLPGPDWVGWHPSVDLEDIKLKVVQNLGEDMHDYDLWASQAQTLINKPYINDDAIHAIMEPEPLSDNEMEQRVEQLLTPHGIMANVFTRNNLSGNNQLDIDMEQDINIQGALSRII